MRYPVAIIKDQDTAYCVHVPDVPGCFSAGDTLDEALINAEEAITGHLEILAEDGVLAPVATRVDDHIDDDEYEGMHWAYVSVDTTPFMGKSEKVTITLPSILVRKVDEAVRNGAAKNRSAFLAESARVRL